MKALVGAFNQEKALVGAFSVIVQLHRLINLRHYSGHRDPAKHRHVIQSVSHITLCHTVSHRSPSLCNANTGLRCQDPASCAGGGWEEGGGKELILAPPTPIQPGATWRSGDTCTLHTSLGARWTQIFTTNQRNTVDRNSKILMLAVSWSQPRLDI